MSHDFQEVRSADEADKVRSLIGKPEAEVGQRVWWVNLHGDVFEGRIASITLGYHGYTPENYPSRRYRAVAERVFYIEYGKGEWRKPRCIADAQDGASETHSGRPDSHWWTLCFTLDKALHRAARYRSEKAQSLRRDADEQEAEEALLLSMRTPEPAA